MTNNDSGENLVEHYQRIDVNEFVRLYKKELKPIVLNSNIELEDQDIELTTTTTGNGGERFWFRCPNCFRRVGVLYMHPFLDITGCRKCLGLKYKSQKYKGMIENEV